MYKVILLAYSADDVPPPCGDNQDCTGMEDGKYPIVESPNPDVVDCGSYYTCDNGVYLGTNVCPDGKYNYSLTSLIDLLGNTIKAVLNIICVNG